MPSLSIVLYTGKGNQLENGKYPIKLRITHNRKPKYIGLGVAALPTQWDTSKERCNSKFPDYQMANFDLDDHMFNARTICREFREKKNPFSFEVFKAKFERENRAVSVEEFFDTLASEQERIKTAHFYRDTKNAIIRVCNNPNVLFTDIDYNWLKNFELYFTRRGKKGIAYFRAIKAAYIEAIKRGIVDQSNFPFATRFNFNGYSFAHLKTKKKSRTTHHRVLPPNEIQLLKEFPIQNYPALAEGYDYFMTSYFAFGLNLKDIIQLLDSDIEGDVIHWDRSKTGIEGCAIISEELNNILKRHKNNSPYLFPIMSGVPVDLKGRPRDEIEEERRYNLNRRVNKQLKKITKILEIEPFTFYSARETVGTSLIRQGHQLSAVSQVLTHATTDTTDRHYNDGFQMDKIRELAKAL